MDIVALRNLMSRRALLKGAPLAAATAVSLGCLAGKAAAQQTKLSQTISKYQDTPKGDQQCSNCSHFVAPSACAIVVDPIKPEGWCQFWAKP
jgi:hypothetical protein